MTIETGALSIVKIKKCNIYENIDKDSNRELKIKKVFWRCSKVESVKGRQSKRSHDSTESPLHPKNISS